ncbi:L-rhamnose mutarotase [Actinoalloteichus spitiensis]|uniref:L-rhamnose mutarotase n=1 Tax=Actinoalloteichus spitiensis TaxID=252394 RepID=UPI000375F822|nr:L-rhamnose mutarotase [Actinoalloteichus spitiensis]
MTQRICFTLQVRPDRLEEYRERHANVWPDMRKALSESGWRNYSLFLREDGLLIGYLECDDFDAAREAMNRTEVNARWQAEMAPLFADLDSGAADEDMSPLPEVFHLP